MTGSTRAQRRNGKGVRTPSRYAALDGYRGLFVVLVIAYHFGVTALVGGWVGINHFFVFSGFLITRLLLKERQKTGRIDVRRFYVRRARRVLPAMFVLVAAVLVHTAFFADAEQRKEYAGDAFATLGFFLNWRLISRGDAYFDQFVDPSPLRHAWTLSVEEQFYVIVPFLVLALVALARRRGAKAGIALALAAVSACWTAQLGFETPQDQTRLYYGTDTRVQALLVGVALGCLLGLGNDKRGPVLPPRAVTQALGVIGFGVSVSAVFLLDPSTTWVYDRGGILLFAVGAALMGWSSVDPRNLLINRIFGWEPLAFLGRISYGLYLYHWPINLWVDVPGLPDIAEAVLKGALTFAAAYLSFRYIEVPVLQNGVKGLLPKSTSGARQFVAVGSALALVLGSGLMWTMTRVSGPPQYVANVPDLVPGQKAYPMTSSRTTVAMVGDSVPLKLVENYPSLNFPGLHPVALAVPGCDMLDIPIVDSKSKIVPNPKDCASLKRDLTSKVRGSGAEAAVLMPGVHLASRHMLDGRKVWIDDAAYRDLAKKRLTETVGKIRAGGAQRVYVTTVPCRQADLSVLPPEDAAAMRADGPALAESQRPDQVNALIREWASEEHVPLLDLARTVCSNPFQPEVSGKRLYTDSVHFSEEATPMIWKWLAPQVLATAQR